MARMTSDENDKAIGMRIRIRRQSLKMSQKELGEKVGGISFQQIQKYENGLNKVSGSMFCRLAQALAMPVGYFFGEFDKELGKEDGKGMKLLELYRKISVPEMKDFILEMAKTFIVVEQKIKTTY